MTRINVGIPPQELTGKHLIAEHREIKRVPNLITTKRAQIQSIPDTFTLGTGHVKFFYDKLGYLLNRYRELYAECLRRGYNVTNFESAWNGVPISLMGDYTPTEHDAKIIRERIAERLHAADTI